MVGRFEPARPVIVISMTTGPLRITVVGAGYVGLVTGVGLAAIGNSVHLIETRMDRLASLRDGRIPIHEAGLQDAFTACVDARRLSVSDRHPDLPADLIMVCVGTPIDDLGQADLRQMERALRSIAPIATDDTVLVIRSTLPVGSTTLVREWSSVETSRTFTNPEFLRQGTAYEDFLHPARIVVGEYPDADPAARDLVLRAVAPITAPRLHVTIQEAELIKNAANGFLGLKLSYTNEIAALCEEYGADVDRVLDGMGLDPRIGRLYMRPSYGFGGSCLPKELQTLANAGHLRGLQMDVTVAASEANGRLQVRFAARIDRLVGGADGRRIGILGLAFKAGTDDLRASPALRVARELLDRGATIIAHDPAAGENARREEPRLVIADRAEEALAGADACVIATEWPEYRDLDWRAIRTRMHGRLVADGRRLLDPSTMRDLGFRYVAVGTPDDSADRLTPARETSAVASGTQ